MPHKQLLVVCSVDADMDTAEAMTQQALQLWPETTRPEYIIGTTTDYENEKSELKGTTVCWIHGEMNGEIYEVIADLQDEHVPVMITRPDETEALGTAQQLGVTTAPPNAAPETHLGILRSLWNQREISEVLKSELKLLRVHQGGLCDQIGKIDEELRMAAQLQREFLPKTLPEFENVAFRVLYRPAGYVSGDIYDVVQLDDEHVGFYLADAVGHGVPAALQTIYIKRSLSSVEVTPYGTRIIPPNEALARLNKDMLKQQGSKVQFATACYGILNTKTMKLQHSRAGHPFSMIMRANGETEWLDSEGGLLGVFEEETYDLMETQLHPGDRLLIYSDGFEVAFPEEEEVATTEDASAAPGTLSTTEQMLLNSMAYTEEFKDLAQGTMDEAIEKLAFKLDHASGSLNQQDDLTAVLVGIPCKEEMGCTQDSKILAA